VQAAREEADRASDELASSAAKEAEAAGREIEEAWKVRGRSLLDDARAQVARFEGVSEVELDRLTDAAWRRLVTFGGRP
jgi:hypothetical protein